MLEDCKKIAMKHEDTVLNENNIFTKFEEQKYTLDNDFKDIS